MRADSRWAGGRFLALLFAGTVVFPALVLAVLAYRSLDSDRQLEERVWRERLEDAARRAHMHLERQVLDTRSRTEMLARADNGLPVTSGGTITVVISPALMLCPASAFAWVPDGRASPVALPAELEQAQLYEMQSTRASQVIARYERLVNTTPAAWRGWVYLRLAQSLLRAGEHVKSRAALQQAAHAPDSPGSFATRFAARLELATDSPDEAAQLYRDLNSGAWLLEKAPYTFYEMRLRESSGGRIPREILASEQQRQAASRLLERVLDGASGWIEERGFAALVLTASHARRVATLVPEYQWKLWTAEAARQSPQDLIIRVAPAGPASARFGPPLRLASLGLPWSVWAEPRDPAAPGRRNESHRRLLLATLVLVAGILVFGSLTTLQLVGRELRVARMQSDFAATVSHEFRSPLTAIRQLGEMLLAGRAANDEIRRRQYYELICRESSRLTRLVDNVLDFSRIEHGRKQYHLERIPTAEWLRQLAGVAEQRRTVETFLPDELPDIEGDREALTLAMLNLLDNAIKYSRRDTAITLRATGQDGWVTLEVRDRGCGIAPDEQHRIFDRFYRGSNANAAAEAKGVGLGLALVRRIADAHGGRIRVESTPGEGSAFFLSLKAAV